MKSSYKIFFAICLLLPFVTTAQNFDTRTAVPKSLSKYDFGMKLDEFTRKNIKATTGTQSMSFRIEYQDKNPDKDIKQVVYYFDAEMEQPLYEMIITFNDVKSLDAHCSKKLGDPNDGKEWKRTTKEGYTFKAWRFGTTLVLALGLPSTEWEKEWDN